VESNLAALLDLTQTDLHEFLSANKSDAFKIFGRVIRWLSESPEIASQLAVDETELPTLNAIVSRANLRAICNLWMENSENSDEEFWQDEFGKHTFVLGLLFAYPIVIIKGKAFVGGKQYDNRHGSLADFLGRSSSSGNAVLIEIKSPTAPLLGSQYRDDNFPPSREVVGAISQVIHYSESLSNAPEIRNGAELSASAPRCVIITGNTARELSDDYRKRSFERFRERLLGVTVVSFDEFFQRIAALNSLFE
jgi:Shedu protein SduA, C-terminal